MYQYVVDAESDEPIMLINKHIGYDMEDGFGIDGSSFQSELLQLDTLGKKRIQIWINSPGGSVMEGMSIYNAILKSKTKVDTYCAGICASIAGVIFQAGRNRIMSDYGLLMYHNPFNSDGSKDEGLDKIKDSLVKMIAVKCGKEEAYISAIMDKTSWINAEEALQAGMCDSIESSSDYNKKRMVQSGQEMRAFWSERNTVLNKLFNNKSEKMIKVANKLGLNPESNEDTILDAVEAIQNKLATSEAKNKTDEDRILALEIEAEAKQKEADAIQAEIDELKNKEAQAQEALATEKATTMVSNFVKIGKVKDSEESITKWVNMAKNDYEGTKAILEDLPLNKVAPKLGEEDETPVPYNMAAIMQAKNQNK